MRRFAVIAASLGLFLTFIAPSVASADVNDFTVTSFKSDETLTKADQQGELNIVEQINVDFTDNNHGILRAIPDRYKGHSLQLKVNKVSSTTGAPAQYTTYGSNGNTVLKVGSPNQTVTGNQEYTINYTLRNVISFYKDHDELYWNVNGDQWSEPFTNVSATIHLPSDLDQIKTPVCYSGSQGSSLQNCTITTNGSTINVNASGLLAYQTLTYVAGFKTGYFSPSKWYQTLAEYTKQIIEVVAPILILGGGSFVYWLMRGRDPKGSGIIVPQYDAPDGLKPAQVGTIYDFKLDNRDISATIIDLAIHGYIKIIETTQNKLIGQKVSYSLQLLNNNISLLNQHEAALLQSLFQNFTVGATVDVSSLKNSLYKTAKVLSSNIEGELTAAGYFRSNPLNSGTKVVVASVIMIFISFYAGAAIGWALTLGIVVGSVIAIIFATKFAARSVKGVTAQEHIKGLKLYLNTAEKDRLEKLQGPQAAYAPASAEPARTVELFEKLLPYAMVLGVEGEWSKQFASIYNSPPNWYAGNFNTFSTLYLVNSLNTGLNTAVNSAFSAPSSSNSSGFGGGFSGGGGGGGGGGGW